MICLFTTRIFKAWREVVERRHAQSRDFFNKVEDPHQLHQGLPQNGDSYRQIAMSLMQERHRTVLDLGTGADCCFRVYWRMPSR